MLTANGFISEILECNQTSSGNLKYLLALNGQEYTLISPQELLVGQDLIIYKKGDFPFYSLQEVDGQKPRPFKKSADSAPQSNKPSGGARRASRSQAAHDSQEIEFPTGTRVEGTCRLTGNYSTKDKWLIYENCISVNGKPLKKVGVARDMDNEIKDGQYLVLNSFDNGEFFMVLSDSFETPPQAMEEIAQSPGTYTPKNESYDRELITKEPVIVSKPILNSTSYWEQKFYYESETRDNKIEFQFYVKTCADIYMGLKSDLESPDQIIDKVMRKAMECMEIAKKV